MATGMPGFLGAVLDEETARRLKAACCFSNVYCRHITLAYRPTPKVYAKYTALVGCQVAFDIVAILCDDKAQAAVVTGICSEKEVPHITMSCRPGVRPSYVNQMLTFGSDKRHQSTFSLSGRGVVEYLRL